MKVEVKQTTRARNGMEVPAGSVLQKAHIGRKTVRGLWCSMWSSYYVNIPRDCCIVPGTPEAPSQSLT